MAIKSKLLAAVAAFGLTAWPALAGSFAIFQVAAPQAISPGVYVLPIGAGGQVTKVDVICDQGVGQCNNSGTTTKVIATDVGGSYRWCSTCINPAGAAGSWVPLVTTASMPSADYVLASDETANGNGVYDIRIAPSNTQDFYQVYNGMVQFSSNQGATWCDDNFSQLNLAANNEPAVRAGHFMAIDPANPAVVILTTPSNGMWYTQTGTSCGSAAWVQISTSTVPNPSGGTSAVEFDPSSSVVSGKTQGIYVGVSGSGVYHFTGGVTSTPSKVTAGSPPTTVVDLKIASDGYVYTTDNTSTGSYAFSGTTWTHCSINSNPNGWAHVAIDPSNAARTVWQGQDGSLDTSSNHCGAFSGLNTNFSRAATDIPWLAWTQESFMTAGFITFDPAQSNVLYFAEGIGVWTTSPSNSTAAFVWTSISAGIEELVANGITSPNVTGGLPLIFSWDRAVFQVSNPGAYPSAHGLNNTTAAIAAGWGVAWSISNPAHVYVQTGGSPSGYSTSGGACTSASCSWNLFGALPAGTAGIIGNGGSIASLSPGDVLWQPSNNGNPYHSTNAESGTPTWSPICVSGVPCTTTGSGSNSVGTGSKTFTVPSGACSNLQTGVSVGANETTDFSAGMNGTISSCSGTTLTISSTSSFGSGTYSSWLITPETGWGDTYYIDAVQACSDGVNYYMYNDGDGLSSAKGVWSGNGTSFTQVATASNFASPGSGVVPRLKCVPGQAGNLFFASGTVTSGPYPHSGNGLYFNTNSGAGTWSPAGNGSYVITEVWDVGFGNACGGNYPVIFLYGWINGTGGVWRSKDGGTTWAQLTDLYLNTNVAGTSNAGGGIIDQFTSIEGDMNVCGRFYAGFKGTGWRYGQFN